jgi:O-antigen/teichoic acid export membrane protein
MKRRFVPGESDEPSPTDSDEDREDGSDGGGAGTAPRADGDNTSVADGERGETDTDDIVRSLGKSGAVVFLGTFLELGIALFAKLLIARELAPGNYGEVTVGLTILTVTAIVSRLGFDTGIPRNAPRYEKADRRGVFVSALQLNVLVSVSLAVGLFLTAGPLADFLNNPQLRPVLRVISVGVPAIPLMRVSLSGTQAVGRSSPKVIVQNLTHPLTRIALVSAVVVFGASPVLVAGAYVASNWAGALAALYFLIRYTPILNGATGWTPKYREMLVFSLPLMATTGLSFILGNTDTLMLQYLQGSVDVGVYDIGYTIAQMLSVGLGSLSYLFLPNISDLHAEERWTEITHLYKLVTKWIAFVTVPPYLIVTYFPERVISVFGSEYVDGSIYLVILASSYFVMAVSGPNKRALSAFGETRYILYVNIFTAGLNVILNLTLIVAIGTVGAAIASTISLVAVHILYCYRLYSAYDITPFSWSLSKPLIPYLLATAVAYVGVQQTIGRLSLAGIVGLVAVAAIVYGIAILSLGGLQEDDVMLVRSAEQSLGVDLEPVKRLTRQFM